MKHTFVLAAALLLSSSLATGQTTSQNPDTGTHATSTSLAITQEASPVTIQANNPELAQASTPATTQEAATSTYGTSTSLAITQEATPVTIPAITTDTTQKAPTPEPASFVNLHMLQRAGGPVQTHIMVDISRAGENSFSYALLSDDISPSGNFAYIQLFHEQKFWQAPLFLHAEYRSYGLDSHCLYLGAAYDFFTPHGMIAVEPLLRNDSLFAGNSLPVLRADSFSAQLSIITGHDWGWCNLNSFTDIWSAARSGSSAGLYSEAWLYFPLNSRLQLGGISCLGWDFALKPQFTVFLGIKINM